MVAAQAQPAVAALPLPRPSRSAEAARALALGYLRYASARWRGDARASVFPLRLSAYWRRDLPPAPLMPPDAVSPHGAAGRGISWHQVGDDVLGYVAGGHGGYRLPVSAVPWLVRCAPVAAGHAPADSVVARPTDCVTA